MLSVAKQLEGYISIHAPLAGSDPHTHLRPQKNTNFNPRSPRGERPNKTLALKFDKYISIHAPLAGSDQS